MTLIRCPDCGRDVSDAARACPACGRPLRAAIGAAAYDPFAAFEYRSPRTLFGLPLVHVVYGPAALGGLRPARGIVAIGNVAVGVVALGGVAVGVVAFGGLALGLVCFAGLALALGLGLGGIATGYWALGGIAVGVHVLGGLGIALAGGPEIVRQALGR